MLLISAHVWMDDAHHFPLQRIISENKNGIEEEIVNN